MAYRIAVLDNEITELQKMEEMLQIYAKEHSARIDTFVVRFCTDVWRSGTWQFFSSVSRSSSFKIMFPFFLFLPMILSTNRLIIDNIHKKLKYARYTSLLSIGR